MTDDDRPLPSELQGAQDLSRLQRFLDHLDRFAAATSRFARRWLLPLRIHAALVLLAAVWCAWRLSGWNGSVQPLAFLAWLLPLSLPAGLLYAFHLVFRVVADLPTQLLGLRGLLLNLTEPARSQLDGLMSRGEGGWLGLGRIMAVGRLLLELRRVADLREQLPTGIGLAPLMANPLYWLLLLLTALIGLGVIALAGLLWLLSPA